MSKDFYSDILHNDHPKKVRKGIWYLFRVYIIVALFLTILVSINISAVLPKLATTAHTILPEGAEVTIQNGVLTTNTNPLVIPLPPGEARSGVDAVASSSRSDARASAIDVTNLLVLDVTASTSIEDLESKDTLALLTSDGFIFKGENGRYSVGKFANLKDLDVTIDEAWLVEKVEWVKGFAKFVPFIAFFFILATMFASSLFFSILYALIIMLILKVQKRSTTFPTAYVIALYSRTFSLAIGLIAYVLPFFGKNTVSIILQLIFIVLMLRSRQAIINEEDDAHEIA